MFVCIANIEVSLQGEILLLFCILLSSLRVTNEYIDSMHSQQVLVNEVRNGPPKLAAGSRGDIYSLQAKIGLWPQPPDCFAHALQTCRPHAGRARQFGLGTAFYHTLDVGTRLYIANRSTQ